MKVLTELMKVMLWLRLLSMYYYNVEIGAYYQTWMKQQKYAPCRMYALNKLFTSTWLCLGDLIQPNNWNILNSGETLFCKLFETVEHKRC